MAGKELGIMSTGTNQWKLRRTWFRVAVSKNVITIVVTFFRFVGQARPRFVGCACPDEFDMLELNKQVRA